MGVAALAQRLSATTWLNGYVLVDASRDVVNQLVLDACSLEMLACPQSPLGRRAPWLVPGGRGLRAYRTRAAGALALRCCCTWALGERHFRHVLEVRLVGVRRLVVDAPVVDDYAVRRAPPHDASEVMGRQLGDGCFLVMMLCCCGSSTGWLSCTAFRTIMDAVDASGDMDCHLMVVLFRRWCTSLNDGLLVNASRDVVYQLVKMCFLQMVLRSSTVARVREIAAGGHMLLSVFALASLLRAVMI